MKTKWTGLKRRAFSMIDLLMALALVVAALVVLPALPSRNVRPGRISCVNNLKNIGLAFRTHAVDNDGLFPWQTNDLRLSGTDRADRGLVSGDLIFIYACLSNELYNPKILICPNDRRSPVGTNWTQTLAANQAKRDTLPSYFVGLNAGEAQPESILSGDRNLSVTNGSGYDWKKVTAGTPAWRWDTDNSSVAKTIRYDAKTLHKSAGNILLGDGSVQQVSSGRLGDAIKVAQGETNRMEWLMPVDH